MTKRGRLIRSRLAFRLHQRLHHVYIGLMKHLRTLILFMTLGISLISQTPTPQTAQPREVVDTSSRPIVFQVRRTFEFDADGVSFSNQFPGARLSSVVRTGTDSYTIDIEPENAPINPSPWYAFRVWAKSQKEISIRLTYPESTRHRYDPQISKDGRAWRVLEKDRITEEGKGTGTGPESRPRSIIMRLKIGKDPIWVSAQELESSSLVFEWMERAAKKYNLTVSEIGKSKEGRPMKMLTIGKPDARKMMMVISRQHPPEVTGYFAMQSFVETIAGVGWSCG